jgi:hypothetical protein
MVSASVAAQAEAAKKAAEAVSPRSLSAAQTVSPEPQWSSVATASNNVLLGPHCLLEPVWNWPVKSSLSGRHVVRC